MILWFMGIVMFLFSLMLVWNGDAVPLCGGFLSLSIVLFTLGYKEMKAMKVARVKGLIHAGKKDMTHKPLEIL